MDRSIPTLSSDELIAYYHQTNKELTGQLLHGASWEQQQQRITTLTEISKELTRRKIEMQSGNDRPPANDDKTDV